MQTSASLQVWFDGTHYHVCEPPVPGETKGRHSVLKNPAEIAEIARAVYGRAAERARVTTCSGEPLSTSAFDMTARRLAARSNSELIALARAAMASGAAIKRHSGDRFLSYDDRLKAEAKREARLREYRALRVADELEL